MAGRIGKYKPKTLEIGQKMALEGSAKKYPYQYVSAFRKRSGYNLRIIKEKKSFFVERF